MNTSRVLAGSTAGRSAPSHPTSTASVIENAAADPSMPGRTAWLVQIHSRTPEVTLARGCGLAAHFGLLLSELSVSPARTSPASPHTDEARDLRLVIEADQDLARLRLLRGRVLNLVDVVDLSERADCVGSSRGNSVGHVAGFGDRGFPQAADRHTGSNDDIARNGHSGVR